MMEILKSKSKGKIVICNAGEFYLAVGKIEQKHHMHKSTIYMQNTMKHCKRIWQEYNILKMDIAKYFDNINKNILLDI